jgi:hypothetical protein
MRIAPMQVLTLALIVVYFAIGIRLTERPQRHLRDPDKHFWFTPMYEPALFTDEGNRLRVQALKFWAIGAVALGLYGVLL